MTPRRAGALALSLALLFGACGGGDEDTENSIGDDATTTSLDPLAGVTGEGAGSTVAGRSATTRSGAPGTTRAPGSPASPRENDVVAVAPGKYNYSAKGTATAKGTVNDVPFNTAKPVDKTWNATYQAPQGRIQRAIYGGDSEVLEHVRSHSGGSADITLLRINNGGKQVTFTPNPPARFVPVPATVGATWSWTLRSEPDNQGNVVTRTADFRVDRVETVTVGGEAVRVLVIIGNMKTDKPTERTHKLTTYYSEQHKLVVKEREIIDSDIEAENDKGQKTKLHIHSDVTATLDSLTPAPPAP